MKIDFLLLRLKILKIIRQNVLLFTGSTLDLSVFDYKPLNDLTFFLRKLNKIEKILSDFSHKFSLMLKTLQMKKSCLLYSFVLLLNFTHPEKEITIKKFQSPYDCCVCQKSNEIIDDRRYCVRNGKVFQQLVARLDKLKKSLKNFTFILSVYCIVNSHPMDSLLKIIISVNYTQHIQNIVFHFSIVFNDFNLEFISCVSLHVNAPKIYMIYSSSREKGDFLLEFHVHAADDETNKWVIRGKLKL